MEQEYISFQALLIFILVNLGSSDRIHNKIYFDMHNKTACVRLLNGTHQIGCQSSERGNVGVVHLIENVDDVEWLRSTGPHSPYVAVVTSDFYNLKSLKALKDSGKVNGVLVIPSNVTHPSPPANGSSPEYSCPNEGYGMYGKEDGDGYSDCNVTTWNPVGDAMNFWDWSIPIFLLDNVMDIRSLLECYKRHNEPSEDGEARDWPLCAAELGDRMFAAIDSVTCIRRTKLSQSLVRFGSGHCDPLGDKNVWATLKPVTKSNPPAAKSIVVAAARMDAFSMFESVAPGADAAVASIVTLLAAAEALRPVIDDLNADDKHVMFTFFQGEAFDYIGSSRMVHDMEAGRFPSPLVDRLASQTALINLTHISHIVEVSQVARIHAGELWLHSDPRMRKNAEVNRTVSELVELLRGHALEVNLKAQEPALKQPLPPASAQRFLRNSSNIPTVVIADHEAEYRNNYYNSRYDDATNIGLHYLADVTGNDTYDVVTATARHLSAVATVVARTLFSLAAADARQPSTEIAADEMTVTHMLYCLLHKQHCELLLTVFPPEQSKHLKNGTGSLYVSVDHVINEHTVITRNLLAYFLGERIAVNGSKYCDDDKTQQLFTYVYMRGLAAAANSSDRHLCMKSTVNYSLARSPAFDDFDAYDVASREFSTWTESTWKSFSVRVFLKPSRQREATTLAVGIVVFVASIAAIWFVSRNSDTLFAAASPSSEATMAS